MERETPRYQTMEQHSQEKKLNSHEAIEHNLHNHPPKDEIVAAKFDATTKVFLDAAHALFTLVPEGREKSLMMTNLEQASMWAKAGIARNQ